MIPNTIKQTENADKKCATPKKVNRLFARFKRQQLVRVNGSRLHILDPAALEELVTI
jgi:hypothetical protein